MPFVIFGLPTSPRPRRLDAFLALAGLIAAGLSIGGCSDGADDAPRERSMPSVEAVASRTGSLPLEERLSGVVRAQNQVAVRAEIAARVVAVEARTGESVEAGQVLVRLDADALRERVRQAEAAVRLAEAQEAEATARVAERSAQVTRTRSLAAESLVSTLDLETQEAQLDAVRAAAAQSAARVDEARATLEERRGDLSKTVVRAPVSGRVGRRQVEVGSQVDGSTLLFELGSLDELVVEVPLTEAMLVDLQAGQAARIQVPDGGSPIEATLDRISPFLSEGSFSTTGEIDVSSAGVSGAGAARLRPGTFVTVDILYGESEQATLVPTSALWEDPRTGIVGVYVAAGPVAGPLPGSGGTAGPRGQERVDEIAFQEIEVIAEGRATAGVSGLEADRWVVTVGQHLLRSDEPTRATIRPTSWERVLDLQSLEREDVLTRFLDKQRRLATEGAEPPQIETFLEGSAEAAPESAAASRAEGLGSGAGR